MVEQLMLAGAEALGIALDEAQARQFARYHRMLRRANEKMNLTRVPLGDEAEAADWHYLDSIAPLGVARAAFEGASQLIDVGSGAGMPGIPLAIMLPQTHVTLLDSQRRRVDFLREVIGEISLNARAVHLRAEDAARDERYRERFDLVVARAVAKLPHLLELTMPFARVGGRVLAYKGPSLADELAQSASALARLGGGAAEAAFVRIPGRDWDHRLLIAEKRSATPASYPRKPSEIAKSPL